MPCWQKKVRNDSKSANRVYAVKVKCIPITTLKKIPQSVTKTPHRNNQVQARVGWREAAGAGAPERDTPFGFGRPLWMQRNGLLYLGYGKLYNAMPILLVSLVGEKLMI